MKRCSKCKIEKDESQFNKDKKRTKDGLSYYCKTCTNEKSKAYQQENREKQLEYLKDYHAKRTSDDPEYNKKTYQKSREKRIEYSRQWAKDHPDKVKEYLEINRKNPKMKEWSAKSRKKIVDNLPDSYIIDLITRGGRNGIKKEEIKTNPDLIEIKRIIIKMQRLCKQKGK